MKCILCQNEFSTEDNSVQGLCGFCRRTVPPYTFTAAAPHWNDMSAPLVKDDTPYTPNTVFPVRQNSHNERVLVHYIEECRKALSSGDTSKEIVYSIDKLLNDPTFSEFLIRIREELY